MQVRAPILIVTLFFVAGILTGKYLINSPSFLLFLYLLEIFLLVTSLIFYFSGKIKLTSLLLLVAIFLCGTLHFCLCYFPSPSDIVKYAPSEDPLRITGKVISSPRLREGNKRRITFIMQVLRVEGKKVNGKVWVTSFYPHADYEFGDIVKIEGKLRLPRNVQKENDFNWQRYLSYQGIWTEITTGRVEILERGKVNLLFKLAFSSKRWIIRKTNKILPRLHSSILRAILLGDRQELSPEILSKFRTTGTAHVLVVSGLHVGLVLGIFLVFFRILGCSLKLGFALALPVIIFYSFITGLRTPILRATLMAGIGIIALLLDRKVNPIVILSLSCFIVLILNPLSIFTVSFQLSFLAVGGIIYLTPFLEEKLSFLSFSWLKKSLSVSLAAQLSLLPLLAFYFGQLPLVGIIANLVVVPLITLVIALGMLSLALASFTLEGARIISNTNWLAIQGLLEVVNFLSFSWNPGVAFWLSPEVKPFPVWILHFYYSLLFLLPWKKHFSPRRILNSD